MRLPLTDSCVCRRLTYIIVHNFWALYSTFPYWYIAHRCYLMVFNATSNHISVISWWSVLLVEETGGHGENHQPAASHWQTLSDNVVHIRSDRDSTELTTPVVIGTDCICSCKSNYHTITTKTTTLTINIDPSFANSIMMNRLNNSILRRMFPLSPITKAKYCRQLN